MEWPSISVDFCVTLCGIRNTGRAYAVGYEVALPWKPDIGIGNSAHGSVTAARPQKADIQ